MKKLVLLLVLIMSFLWTGFLCTEKVYANETKATNSKNDKSAKTDKITLSDDFLEDLWVNENGFVCEYETTVLMYGTDTIIYDCEFTKNGIQGITALANNNAERGSQDSNAYQFETKKLKLKVLTQDSIQIDGKTAYRCSSKKGKACLSKVKKKLMGEWILLDEELQEETLIVITKDQMATVDTCGKETSVTNYTFDRCGIAFDDPMTTERIRVQIVGDRMTWSFEEKDSVFYWKDSKSYKEKQKELDNFLDGKWFFQKYDYDSMELWEIAEGKLTYKTLKKDAKSKTVPYVLKRDAKGLHLKINKTTYNIYPMGEEILISLGEDTYTLFHYDSALGKEAQKKMKILEKNGAVEKRSLSCGWQDIIQKKIKVTLACPNNIVLDDMIDIANAVSGKHEAPYLSGFQIHIKGEYSNASITIKYDASKLLYDCEDDLAIVSFKNDQMTLLDTKVDKKYHTVTATYAGDGDYYLVDRMLCEGEHRDPLIQRSENTKWALSETTGDILKLVDLDYLKKADKKFNVSTPAQLASVIYYVNTIDSNVAVELENDLDLSNYEWAPMGWRGGWTEMPFTGSFNGNHHTIKGLHMKGNGYALGLIGVATNVTVKDLTIEDADIDGARYTGVLAGEVVDGTFENCTVSGMTQGYDNTGAMFGVLKECGMKDCKANVLVNGELSQLLYSNQSEAEQYKCYQY